MCLKCDNPEWTEIVREQFDDVEIPVKLCGDCYEKFLVEAKEQERVATEKLELAKKIVAAMDLGADIDISFFNIEPEKAEKMCATLHEGFNLAYKKREYPKYDSYSTTTDSKCQSNITLHLYTKDYKDDSHERTA